MADDPKKPKDTDIRSGTFQISPSQWSPLKFDEAARSTFVSALSSQVKLSDFVSVLSTPGTIIDSSLISFRNVFEEELVNLKKKYDEQRKDLDEAKNSGRAKAKELDDLRTTLAELETKERIRFLLDRVNQQAQSRLLSSGSFREIFLQSKECKAIVMAVDIRRSTDLMLKARKPEDFASFITAVSADLMRIITDHYGVFDKFTGDGVLAFFPDFFTGDDAAYLAVAAADKCHAAFRARYSNSRSHFSSVLKDIGLGIGLDYGAVHLVKIAGGLTVVGEPVVYACRLSVAPPNKTLVNQPAYEKISETCGSNCFIDETEVEIKHEGGMVAYEVRLNGREVSPKPPDWTTVTTDDAAGNS